MKSITYVIGDATRPKIAGRKIIAHICNDSGAWGKGFVLALSKVSIAPERAFRQWHANRANNDFALGSMQFVQFAPETLVANMIGQHKIRAKHGIPPIRYEAVEKALSAVCREALRLGASVHLPRIGCGLAGGDWRRIQLLLEERLCAFDVSVFVYDLCQTQRPAKDRETIPEFIN